MQRHVSQRTILALLSMAACVGLAAVPAGAQVVIDAGYLDTFNLTDGRIIDVGELGGGIQGSPTTDKITVTAQPTNPSPPMPSDGRLTGTVHGKLRVNFLTDVTGDGFINGSDLDSVFDVTWNLVGFDKTQGPSSAFFMSSSAVGPEGTVAPFGPSVNFPPGPGGTASTWTITACDGAGMNPGSGSNPCNPFAIPSSSPYTGFVDYTFPVSIPGANDFTPGLTISNTNWILAALVARTSQATPAGAVSFGSTALYNPQLAVTESMNDLFGPSTLLNYPGEQANVNQAGLLTTVQINVIPEPTTAWLVGLAGLALLRRRR